MKEFNASDTDDKLDIGSIFDRRADTFDNLPWVANKDFLGNIFAVIYDFIEEGNRNMNDRLEFLDVGTGTGEVLKYFLDTYPEQGLLQNAYGEGIDVSKKMSELAVKKIGLCRNSNRVKISNSSIYGIDIEENRYDFIVCRNSLHHFVSLERGFEIMSRILKKDGEILIIEGVAPDIRTLNLWKPILKLKDTGRNGHAYFSLDYLSDFFNEFAKGSNLEVSKIVNLTTTPMLVSQWLSNAPFMDPESYNEILDMIRSLYRNRYFVEKFGLKKVVKYPIEKQDFEIKRRSALISLRRRS